MIEKMTSNGVCAIFTTFHPGPDVLVNIAAVRSQVQYLAVVDNGSTPEILGPLLDAAMELDFHVIANTRNKGIAAALNLGSRWAIESGSKFLLYFDQDSTATEGMVEALLETYRSSSSSMRVGIVATTNRERQSGLWEPPLYDAYDQPVVAMTSGTLLPVAVFEECGAFEDDFFIEFVDHEYSLRTRSKGYQIVLCPSAVLIHDVGFPRDHSFLGLFRCRCTHHRPARRYYFVRNLTVLLMRYRRQEPHWCLTEFASLLKSAVKITLFEEYRLQKLWMGWRGALDGLREAMGYRVQL